MSYIIIGVLLIGLYLLYNRNLALEIQQSKDGDLLKSLQKDLLDTLEELGKEREVNRTLLSQKKSSETRLGQITEHLVPFLDNCRHDPKQMHFLGNPIDYIVFNFDAGEITFLEVKSGNSKPSKRQKTIKNLIKTGRVYYEEIRINEKGVKNKLANNEISPNGDIDAETEESDN